MSTMYPNRKRLASNIVSDLTSGFSFQNGNNAVMENRIKEFRKKLGLSQEDVAKKVGTTRATIMKLEKGDMNLTTTWMNRLALKAFHCRPQDLLPGTEPRDQLRDSEVAIIYTLKAIIKILLQKQATSPKALDTIFMQAFETYEAHHLKNAAMIMDDLHKYVIGPAPSSEQEVIHKLLSLAPLGSA